MALRGARRVLRRMNRHHEAAVNKRSRHVHDPVFTHHDETAAHLDSQVAGYLGGMLVAYYILCHLPNSGLRVPSPNESLEAFYGANPSLVSLEFDP